MNRQLGANGPLVSAIGLGCMGMSGAYGPSEEKECIATIERALEMGHNLIDTADYYRAGHNEMLIAKALQGKREKAFLSVKTGQLFTPGEGKSIGIGPVNGHPDYLRNAVLYSLQRLQTDYIDLYTPARIDPQVPVEETVSALSDLVKSGFVRYIGLSEASAASIRKAAAVHPVTALQIEYSLWSRDIEAEVLPAVRECGIGLVAYAPLSRGFLGGTIKTPDDLKDNRANSPRFQGTNFYRNLALVEQIKVLAAEKDCTPAQLALAWVLAQGNDVVTIPGSKRIGHLEENIAAQDVQLTPGEMESIEAIMPAGVVAGTRYAEKYMEALNR